MIKTRDISVPETFVLGLTIEYVEDNHTSSLFGQCLSKHRYYECIGNFKKVWIKYDRFNKANIVDFSVCSSEFVSSL